MMYFYNNYYTLLINYYIFIEHYRMPKPHGLCNDRYYDIMFKC